MLVAFGTEGGDVVKRVGDAKLLVFVGAHGVIGKEFDALHIIIYREVLSQGGEALVDVGVVGHEYVANPGGFTYLVKVVEKGLVVLPCVACVVLVQGVIEGLDVQQDEVGVFQHLLGFLAENHAAGVECGVESCLMAETKKLNEKVGLHEGFAA